MSRMQLYADDEGRASGPGVSSVRLTTQSMVNKCQLWNLTSPFLTIAHCAFDLTSLFQHPTLLQTIIIILSLIQTGEGGQIVAI